MKKILLIQQVNILGGSGIGLCHIASMLKAKYDVVVYLPQNLGGLSDYLSDHGIKTAFFCKPIGSINFYNGSTPVFSRSFALSLKNMPKSRLEFEAIFKKEKPDIVIVNSMILSWLAKTIKNANAISICHVRETIPPRRSWLVKMMLKRQLEMFDKVMFISEYDRREHNLKHPKTEIIRDTLAENQIGEYASNQNLTDEKHNLKLLFVGGGDPIKGLQVLLEALILLNNSNISLFVAGFMPIYKKALNPLIKRRFNYINKVNSLIKNPIIQNNIHICGQVENISELYKSCDVLVFPSTVAHQSRPAFEAGIYGKTCIISDFPATQEYIRNNINGLTFKPNDPESLALNIKKLYDNPVIIASLGDENRKAALSNNDFNKVKNTLLEFIEK